MTLVGIVAGGIGVSVYLFTLLRRTEKATAVADIEQDCDVKSLELKEGLSGCVTVMYAMRDIVGLRGNMTNREWNEYSQGLISSGNWSLLSLSEIDVVPLPEVEEWQRSTGITLRQVSNGNLVPAELNRPLYAPIVNTYPQTADLLGLDNYYESNRKDVLQRGARSRSLALSDPFIAPNANPLGETQRAFLLFLPFFDSSGRWTGGITEAFFETAILSDRFGGKNTYAFGIEGTPLFSDSANSGNIHARRSFDVGDRTLTLRCVTNFQHTAAPVIVVTLGTFLSLVLPSSFSVLLIGSRYRQRIANDREMWTLKTNLLNNVSHELRTPLNATSGMLDALHDEHLDDEQRGLVATAKSGTETLAGMIDDLIDFSSIESGRFQLAVERFSFEAFLSEALSQWSQEIANDKLIVKNHVERYTIETDRRCLRKIVRALVSNGLKYSKENATEPVTLLASMKGDLVIIVVKDQGIGIPKDHLPHVGNELQQGDVTNTREFGGLGLSLTLVRRYLALMNGSVEVQSSLGVGSTFTVTLPCHPEEIAAEESILNVSNEETRRKILIVDDNLINQKVLLKLLRDKEVIVASDGEEALERIRQHGHSIALVLMDIQMPKMDGYQATAAIRKAGYGVPVVAVTANAPIDQTWRTCGMNEFIQKPLKKERLASLLVTYGVP